MMSPQLHEFQNSKAQTTQADAKSFDELRNRVGEITAEFNEIVERRARAASQSVNEGVGELRTTIRRQPVISLSIAAIAGALLAAAVMPRRSSGRDSRALWSPVTRADLYELADSVQRSMSRSFQSVPMTSTLERLAEAVSRVDNSAGFSSTFEKIGNWLQQKSAAAMADKKSD